MAGDRAAPFALRAPKRPCFLLLVNDDDSEILEHREATAWLGVATGFLTGAGFIRLADLLRPHLHPGATELPAPEGPPTAWRTSTLLFTAMTLHSIPEGAAVGVAFGALAHPSDYALSTTMAANPSPPCWVPFWWCKPDGYFPTHSRSPQAQWCLSRSRS